MPDRRELICSLQSTLCPACGGRKERYQTLCRLDYYRLPQALRNALYNPIGKGYEQACAAAMERLNVATPQFPLAPPAIQEASR